MLVAVDDTGASSIGGSWAVTEGDSGAAGVKAGAGTAPGVLCGSGALAGAFCAAFGGVDAVSCAGPVETRADGSVCAGARVFERGTATGSAERVTVPLRVKFWRSRGPTASVAGVSLGVVASWASAGNGASARPTAEIVIPKRRTALINSRFLLVNRATCADTPMPFNRLLFKHGVDEWERNSLQRASTSTSSESSWASIATRDSPVIATPSRAPASIPFTRTLPLGTR